MKYPLHEMALNEQRVVCGVLHTIRSSKASSLKIGDRPTPEQIQELPKIEVNFNKKEALAFHVAYKNNFFDTDDYLLSEIFTQIDRTI